MGGHFLDLLCYYLYYEFSRFLGIRDSYQRIYKITWLLSNWITFILREWLHSSFWCYFKDPVTTYPSQCDMRCLRHILCLYWANYISYWFKLSSSSIPFTKVRSLPHCKLYIACLFFFVWFIYLFIYVVWIFSEKLFLNLLPSTPVKCIRFFKKNFKCIRN